MPDFVITSRQVATSRAEARGLRLRPGAEHAEVRGFQLRAHLRPLEDRHDCVREPIEICFGVAAGA